MAKRVSVEIPGLSHGAPIPMGARIGNLVYSSGISGRDPKTNELPTDPDRQAERLFQNVRTFMAQAGGTTDAIIRMTVYVSDEKYRETINHEWLKMFPDAHDRPARHATRPELRGGVLFQVEVVAVL
jgi:2-iminobutanoate/2-iminopropanoate deaminase